MTCDVLPKWSHFHLKEILFHLSNGFIFYLVARSSGLFVIIGVSVMLEF